MTLVLDRCSHRRGHHKWLISLEVRLDHGLLQRSYKFSMDFDA
jgi:hypothetical protein